MTCCARTAVCALRTSWAETIAGLGQIDLFVDWEAVLVRRTKCCQCSSILTAVKIAVRLEMVLKST